MPELNSADGTKITFTIVGAGPVIILVAGGLDDGSENSALVDQLSERFTVINYARRGRGGSADTQPYAVEREIDDLAALMVHAGRPVSLYGVSSGGALALEAAAAGLPIERIAVYEVPYQVSDQAVAAWTDYRTRLTELLGESRQGEALELFMSLAGSTDDDIAAARQHEAWPRLEQLAPTLAYDAACVGAGPPPTDRIRSIDRPVLAMTGTVLDPGMTELPAGFFDAAADAIVAAAPRGERRILTGQGHLPGADAVAAALAEFVLPEAL